MHSLRPTCCPLSIFVKPRRRTVGQGVASSPPTYNPSSLHSLLSSYHHSLAGCQTTLLSVEPRLYTVPATNFFSGGMVSAFRRFRTAELLHNCRECRQETCQGKILLSDTKVGPKYERKNGSEIFHMVRDSASFISSQRILVLQNEENAVWVPNFSFQFDVTYN